MVRNILCPSCGSEEINVWDNGSPEFDFNDQLYNVADKCKCLTCDCEFIVTEKWDFVGYDDSNYKILT